MISRDFRIIESDIANVILVHLMAKGGCKEKSSRACGILEDTLEQNF